MAAVGVVDGNLVARGATILSSVHDNVVLTPAKGSAEGVFIGVERGCRSVFPIGKLWDLRFMCTFRYRLWWMTQRMGTCGREIPTETQFLIVEGIHSSYFEDGIGDGDEHPAIYTVFLPLLEGNFRAALQGNENNELEICLESGDPVVEEFKGTYLVCGSWI